MGKKSLLVIYLFIVLILTGCALISTKETTGVISTVQTTQSSATNTIITTTPPINTKSSLTNPDEIVVDFNHLLVKSSELYEIMKLNYGYQTMIREVDQIVLKDYFNQVDEMELASQIYRLKNNDLNSFYELLAEVGIFPIGDETYDSDSFINRYKEYFKYYFNLVHKAAGAYRAKQELTKEEIQKVVDEYKPDECIMTLSFSSRTEHDEAYALLSRLKGQNLLSKFVELYKQQGFKFGANYHLSSEAAFFDKMINCNVEVNGEQVYTERILYNTSSPSILDFIYDIKIGEIGTKIYSEKYNIVYKVSQAKAVEDYTQNERNEFEKLMIERLVNIKNSQSYIRDTVNQLRIEAGFKIYDIDLAKQHARNERDFKASFTNNPNAVYEINNQVISSDHLYNSLKKTGAVLLIMNKINYAALNQIEEIALTSDETRRMNEKLNQMKAQFLQQNYDMTWQEYMQLFGAFSETDLTNLFALDELTNRYILGYKVDQEIKYPGVNPVTFEEIRAKYNEWFEMTASHILFKVDQANSSQRAELLAKQVIAGYDAIKDEASGILTQKEFLKYDYNQNGTIEETEYFKGLINTDVSEYAKVFAYLARTYSNDAGSAVNNGKLGLFGPNKMVKEFEDAARNVAERFQNKDFPFSNLEKNDEGEYLSLAETEFGFHVIYVTNLTKKPPVPAGYEHVTLDEMVNVENNLELKAYYDALVKIKFDLIAKHIENYQNYLIQLRNDQGFHFLDPILEDYLKKIEVNQ